MLEHDSEQRAAAPAEKRGQEPADKPGNGSGVGQAAQPGSAADGGEAVDIPVEVVDAIEAEVEPPVSRPSIMTRPSLTAHEADRFAASFRPSWAHLEPEPIAPAATVRGSFKPVVARGWDGSPIVRENREPEEKEDNVRASIAGPRRRALRRASVLATLSIASFLALTYWGISNTTHPAAPAPQATQASTELHTKEIAPPPAEAPAPIAPAAAVETRRQPRLADPDNPEPAAVVQQAEPEAAEVAATAEQPGAEAPATVAVPAAEVAKPASEPANTPAAEETTTHPALAAAPPAVPVAPPPSAAKPAEPAPAAVEKPAAAPVATAAAVKPPQPSAAAPELKNAPAEAHALSPLLVVRALPEDAHLWLDGQRMANPFDVRLPRGYKHKIEARSPGYEDSSQTIRIESDARLTISLRRAVPSPEPRVQVKPLARAQGAGFVTTNPY